MNRTKKISYLGIGIALYVVVSMLVKIPIVNRIKLDMGYIVFALYLNSFGVSASIVGVAGCIIANMLSGGSFPIAWAMGQLLVGLTMGSLFPKTEKLWLKILAGVIAVFLGIGALKTILEILMFRFPFWAKFSSNLAAVLADSIPFVIGILLTQKIKIK